jgi:hypothetical protein
VKPDWRLRRGIPIKNHTAIFHTWSPGIHWGSLTGRMAKKSSKSSSPHWQTWKKSDQIGGPDIHSVGWATCTPGLLMVIKPLKP